MSVAIALLSTMNRAFLTSNPGRTFLIQIKGRSFPVMCFAASLNYIRACLRVDKIVPSVPQY